MIAFVVNPAYFTLWEVESAHSVQRELPLAPHDEVVPGGGTETP
jgi:hypothetical protein